MKKLDISFPEVDKENALRNACKKCVARGYSIAWMRSNMPGLFQEFTFEHVYSVYMQERHKRLYSPSGVSLHTFIE